MRARVAGLVMILVGAGTLIAQVPPNRLQLNPALADLAQRDPARLPAILDGLAAISAGRPKGAIFAAPDADDATRAMLATNPDIAAAYAADPSATLDLIRRIRDAGGKGQ